MREWLWLSRTGLLPDICTLWDVTNSWTMVKLFFFFLKSFWQTHVLFWGPLVPLFWISGDVSSGFQSQIGLPYLHCRGERNVHSARSTSGATLANLYTAGMQPVLSPYTVAEVRLPGFELVLSEYLWARRSTNCRASGIHEQYLVGYDLWTIT